MIKPHIKPSLIYFKSKTKWLDKNNAKQGKWALKYLGDKGFRPKDTLGTSDYKTALIILETIYQDELPEFFECFISKMWDAWRAKVSRKKRGGKQYFPFTLDKKTKTKLEAISKKSKLAMASKIQELIEKEHQMQFMAETLLSEGIKEEITFKAKELEQAPVEVIEAKEDACPTHEFTTSSPSGQKLWGYKAEDLDVDVKKD